VGRGVDGSTVFEGGSQNRLELSVERCEIVRRVVEDGAIRVVGYKEATVNSDKRTKQHAHGTRVEGTIIGTINNALNNGDASRPLIINAFVKQDSTQMFERLGMGTLNTGLILRVVGNTEKKSISQKRQSSWVTAAV